MRAANGYPPVQQRYLVPVSTAAIVSVITVWKTGVSALLFVGVWAWLSIRALSPQNAVLIPALVLLTIPADYISWLSGPNLGMFACASLFILLGAARWRGPVVELLRADYDLVLLVGILAAGTLIHYQTGQLRLFLFWVSGAIALAWLRALESRGCDVAPQLFRAIVLAGSFAGLLAILEWILGLRLDPIVPGYAPARLDFGTAFGQRASALSGHPLRLGTITMLGAVLVATALPHTTTRKERWLCWAALLACAGGLLTSGARGAWLGFLVGLSGAVLTRRRLRLREWRPLLVPAVAIGGLVLASGLWSLAQERVLGEAFQPGSFGQRLAALNVFERVWSRTVMLGVGLGGVAELTSAAGLVLPNLENEYIRLFLAAGVLAPLSLIFIGVRRTLSASRSSSYLGVAAVGGILALLVNVATYNLFSWSMGPALLTMLAVMSMPGRPAE